MRRVALFISRFLQYSQTFVYEEIRAHQRYHVEVFTRAIENQERFPYASVNVAGPLYAVSGYSPRFHRRFAEDGIELAHAHFGTAGVSAMHYARVHDVPLAVTFHGFDVPMLSNYRRFAPNRWGYALLGRTMLRRMDLGLCASNELREGLLALGVPAEKLVLHQLGVDLGKFCLGAPRAAAPLRVIMVGRFAAKKGFRYGLAAFAKAQKASPLPMELRMVGDGEEKPMLEKLVRELGVTNLTFTGPLAPDAVVRELQAAHVLLAPSVTMRDRNRESGLIVVKEANACGAVAIGTIHGGIPEIIDDGETGYLVPERDVDAMAERLGRLAAEPGLRERMARAARAKMERQYDQRERVAALEDHYDRLIERKRAER